MSLNTGRFIINYRYLVYSTLKNGMELSKALFPCYNLANYD